MKKNNAVFVDAGLWLRPRYYKQGEENLQQAAKREATNVRNNVGICDVTSLGKIDIKGKDSAEFRVLDHNSQLSMSADVEFLKI